MGRTTRLRVVASCLAPPVYPLTVYAGACAAAPQDDPEGPVITAENWRSWDELGVSSARIMDEAFPLSGHYSRPTFLWHF
jgi:hypothetical protein